jgi:hypothetical protein
MEFLIGLFALIGSFLAGFFGHVLAHDFCEFTPRMCQKLIERAVSLLPEGDRDRYREEWLSHLNECAGVIKKFEHAGSCVLGAHRLGRVRSIIKPHFRILRIGFDEIGFLELDFATSMVVISFFTSTADDFAQQHSLRSRLRRLLRLQARRNLTFLWLAKNLAAACIRHRKLGPIDAKQIAALIDLLGRALRTKNANLKIYRDGVQIDLSQQQAELKKAFAQAQQ